MSYHPSHALRRCAVFAYNSAVTTMPASASSGAPFQPLDVVLHTGPVTFENATLRVATGSATIRGINFTSWIESPLASTVMLDIVAEMNLSGDLNSNNYMSIYAVTDSHTYIYDVRSFEQTSEFYEGSNKSILHITDDQTWARIDSEDNLGWVFESAAGISNDMISPYSRLYGWGGIR